MNGILVGINFGISVLNIILALITLIANPRRTLNLTASLFLLFTALWNVANAYYYREPSLFSLRMTYATAIFFVTSCALFILSVRRKVIPLWIFLSISVLSITLFIITMGSELVVKQLSNPNLPLEKWSPGALFFPYSLYLVVLVVWFSAALVLQYRQSQGLPRLQVQYILLGFSSFAFLSILGSLALFLCGSYSLNSWVSPLTILLSSTFTYVTVFHRLFDIRRMLVRMIMGIFLVFILLSLNAIFLSGIKAYFSTVASSEISLILATIISGLLVLIFKRSRVYKFLGTFVGNPNWDLFHDSLQIVMGTLDQKSLLRFIAETLQNCFHLQQIQIYWANAPLGNQSIKYQPVFDTSGSPSTENRVPSLAAPTPVGDGDPKLLSLSDDKGNNCSTLSDTSLSSASLVASYPLSPNDILPTWLRQESKSLVYEEYQLRSSAGADDGLSHLLKEHHAKVVVPCIIRGELHGWVMLGEKPQNDAFTKEDIDVVELFLLQASIALHNAFLYEDAISDGLTRLFNRRYVSARLIEQFEIATRYQKSFAVLMVDIDHFKNVNDQFGHQTGDHVLIAVAECLRQAVRTTDIIARYGGEEFIVMLQDFEESALADWTERIEKVYQVAERIRIMVEDNSIAVERHLVKVTISIGGCMFDAQYGFKTYHEMVHNADLALYMAKEHGRNRVLLWHDKEFFTPNQIESSSPIQLKSSAKLFSSSSSCSPDKE